MLEWLKAILGDGYTEDIDEKISKEIGKGFVSRTDFNAKVNALRENEKTINEQTKELDNLRQTNVDAAAAQKQLDDLKKTHEAEIAQLKLGFAVESALKDAGARNTATVMPLLEGFLKDAKFADDGQSVEGLADQIKHLTEDESTSFLFNPKKQAVEISGADPANPGSKGTPAQKDPKDMNYDELCEYFDNQNS